jgi:hypothetical protein
LKQDNGAKPYAFLCVAHFFNAFRGAEDKVMLKAFINMVRTSSLDSNSREAVKEAIDVILPLLDASSKVDAEGGDIDRRSSQEISIVSYNSSLYSSLSSSLTSPSMLTQSSLLDGVPSQSRKKPSYAAPLKKVLVEEGGTQSATLLVILQMIVRNREIFYYSR